MPYRDYSIHLLREAQPREVGSSLDGKAQPFRTEGGKAAFATLWELSASSSV
jgi:hypothetical protein